MGSDHGEAHHGREQTSRDNRNGQGSAMGFVAWLLVGVLAAWIADAIPPDSDSTRVRTLLVSVAGALLGGAAAALMGIGSVASFFTVGAWLCALAGAAACVVIDGMLLGANRQRPCPPLRPIQGR
jgi:uncharacterized membrane protein YeaQ/YmgE (transglycosylase-associated protein family)